MRLTILLTILGAAALAALAVGCQAQPAATDALAVEAALLQRIEAEVGDAIAKLRGKTTLILVAHRLSTIMQADEIFYMREGRIVDHGTFRELVARVPDFALQAELSGLS